MMKDVFNSDNIGNEPSIGDTVFRKHKKIEKGFLSNLSLPSSNENNNVYACLQKSEKKLRKEFDLYEAFGWTRGGVLHTFENRTSELDWCPLMLTEKV